MSDQPITGIILAGGASTRMGCDKMHLPFDGQPLIAHVVQALRPLCEELLIVTNDTTRIPMLDGADVVEDIIPGAHALGGLYTGLRLATHQRCVVTTCDAPRIQTGLLAFLASAISNYDAAVPVGAHGLHPLCAAYAARCVGVIEHQIAQEQWSVQACIALLHTYRVPPDLIHQYDAEELSLQNINTPDEYQALIQSGVHVG
jgi:molybdenum cofactor guanylyltransferase